MMLKVLSYNLYFHKGNRDVIDLIKKTRPDILCFQEIKNDSYFFKKLEINGFNLANISPSFKKYGENFYIATFYNKETINLSFSNYLDLPKSIYEKFLSLFSKNHFPRSFIKTLFQVQNKEVLLINTHLSPWATDIERVQQLKKLINQIEKENKPVIILGDFNYPYGRKRLENIIQSANLKEASSTLLYTFETKILKLIPIRLKLDYVLYKNIFHKKTILLEKMNSDHFPILTNFEL